MQTAEEIYEVALDQYRAGDRLTAGDTFGRAALLNPGHDRAFANRGVILFETGHVFDAVLNYDRAIAVNPAPQYLVNKGSALIELNQWEQAAECFRDAVLTKPDFDRGWNHLGRLLLMRGYPYKATVAFAKAIEINPNYIDAHLGMAFACLEQGDFGRGFKEYEWRRMLLPDRNLPPKDWIGEKLNDDEGILLCSEQGIGDVIQFARYAPLIKQRFGGRVYIESRPSLYRLLRTIEGIDGVISYGDPFPPDVKYFTMLMSCPLIFGHTSADSFPAQQSYLKASPDRVASFVPIIKALPETFGVKVGFCWAGNAGLPSVDRRRSTNLSMWEPLGRIPGIGWVSLQKGPAASQINTTHIGMTILNAMSECDDMADTAALIMHCDLVITVDTSIAHLAAALGKQTWVLSRRDACWRWLGDRRDSPWYPTVSHFRQKNFDDWPGLMSEVASDLGKLVAQTSACGTRR